VKWANLWALVQIKYLSNFRKLNMSYKKKNKKEAVITFRYPAKSKKALQMLADLERTTASRIIQEAVDARLAGILSREN
jgi:hypothetical protein